MSKLVFCFDQVQLGNYSRMLLKSSLADSKQILYAVLCLLLDFGLVE